MGELLHAQKGSAVFLIEENEDGVFLFTYRSGRYTGDSWHPNVEEAKAQAAYNAGSVVGPWKSVSSDFKSELDVKSKSVKAE